MGKVRELVSSVRKSRAILTFEDVRVAEREDAEAHAAELEAKDKQIEAVQEAHYADIRRIAELEAELAKRELPPLPESVREYVERIRSERDFIKVCGSVRDLVAWVDTHYPAPVPQWELDAQVLERGGRVTEDVCKAIAARIREAGRVNSK